MTYENLRLGHSPITDRIYVGKLNKEGDQWTGQKKDVTNDFIDCVIGRWNGYVEKVKSSKGKIYEISVREIE